MTTALALAALSGGAQALNLDFGVTYRSGGAALRDNGLVRFGVSDVSLGRGTLSAGVSNQALEVGVTQGFGLPLVGAVSGAADAAVTWGGGVRLTSRVNATLGPVALNAGGAFFTAGATAVDPLAAWTLAPTDLRERGWNADVTARYRVSRTLIAVAGGEFGAQPQVAAGVEWRHDLTRALPPAEGDDPEAKPATERTGSVTLRLGARAGRDVLGATGGVTYSAESGVTLALDALAGTGVGGAAAWGASGSLGAPDLLGEGSLAQVYVAYEPWRTASAPLRVGTELRVPTGSGTLSVDVRGGRFADGSAGFGARVGYSFPLGGPPEEPGEEP
ncbi:hypothetical protein DAETH_22530 [Deinococcus aetherius]|uniref:Uncharacterized protein n=2 Tax=Deinococcus aetherius TaxID=200252 RepID=A0ABM8AES1_9DEIO|nr:hypothetical protein DAETH_22530 [Deinococcus aetherius]